MIAVAITAVLSTALLVSFVFNRIIRQQVLEDLRVSCRMIESVGKFDKAGRFRLGKSENYLDR